jgi:hypothetical protein
MNIAATTMTSTIARVIVAARPYVASPQSVSLGPARHRSSTHAGLGSQVRFSLQTYPASHSGLQIGSHRPPGPQRYPGEHGGLHPISVRPTTSPPAELGPSRIGTPLAPQSLPRQK